MHKTAILRNRKIKVSLLKDWCDIVIIEHRKVCVDMSIIECKNLTKEYISGDSVIKAVDNVTVAFEQGEFCAIIGPSGSGKSTLLHILSSLEHPTSGAVIYGEKKLSDYNDNQLSILRRRRFGFVFQSYNLVNELTGYENILLPIMLDKKKTDQEYIDKLIKMLEEYGVPAYFDEYENIPSDEAIQADIDEFPSDELTDEDVFKMLKDCLK